MTDRPVPEPGSTPSALLLLSTWLPEDLREPFADWCDAHQSALAGVPGVRRARRARFDEGSGGSAPDLLTMYEVDDIAITRSEVWRERSATAGPLPSMIAERLRSERRDLGVVTSLPRPWWPPRPSRRLDVFTLTDGRRAEEIARAIDAMSSDAATPVTLRVVGGDAGPSLVLIDHHDDDGDDLIDALTDTSGAYRSRWTIVFDRSDGAEDDPPDRHDASAP